MSNGKKIGKDQSRMQTIFGRDVLRGSLVKFCNPEHTSLYHADIQGFRRKEKCYTLVLYFRLQTLHFVNAIVHAGLWLGYLLVGPVRPVLPSTHLSLLNILMNCNIFEQDLRFARLYTSFEFQTNTDNIIFIYIISFKIPIAKRN